MRIMHPKRLSSQEHRTSIHYRRRPMRLLGGLLA
jgi:hypothetical protein